jgi:hypothetical protein
MDNAGSPVLSFAADARLHHVSVHARKKTPPEMAGGSLVKMKAREKQVGLQDEVPYLDGRRRKKSARNAFAGADRIVHHLLWQYLFSLFFPGSFFRCLFLC